MSLTDTERRRGVPCFASTTPESVKNHLTLLKLSVHPKTQHILFLRCLLLFFLFLTLISNPAIHYVEEPVCVAAHAYLDISLFVYNYKQTAHPQNGHLIDTNYTPSALRSQSNRRTTPWRPAITVHLWSIVKLSMYKDSTTAESLLRATSSRTSVCVCACVQSWRAAVGRTSHRTQGEMNGWMD